MDMDISAFKLELAFVYTDQLKTILTTPRSAAKNGNPTKSSKTSREAEPGPVERSAGTR
jgi:hypothetical protein